MFRIIRVLTTAVAIQCMLGAALLMVLMDKPMPGQRLSAVAPASYAQMVEHNPIGTALSVSGISVAIMIATICTMAYAVSWYWRRRSQVLRDSDLRGAFPSR
ncbi:MAG: hypothetical protein AAF577_05180 [Pseudomonadota bacterium]